MKIVTLTIEDDQLDLLEEALADMSCMDNAKAFEMRVEDLEET